MSTPTKANKTDSTVAKSRPEWAAEIHADYKKTIEQSIEGILKIGRTLIAAKKALPHGAFLEMIDHDLPFDSSTAQRLMKIARDPRIAKAVGHKPEQLPSYDQ